MKKTKSETFSGVIIPSLKAGFSFGYKQEAPLQ